MGCVVSSDRAEAGAKHRQSISRREVWPLDPLSKEEAEEAKLAEDFDKAEAVVNKLADLLTTRAAKGSLQDFYAINTQNIGTRGRVVLAFTICV